MIKSHVVFAVFGGMLAFGHLPSPADDKLSNDEILRRLLEGVEKNPLVERLESEDPGERGLAFVDLREQHRLLVKNLIAIADKPKNEYLVSDSRDLAVRLLAELRASKAVPVLVRNVDCYRFGRESIGASYKGYPCAKALAAIGQESIKGIYMHLLSAPHDARSRERLLESGKPVREPLSDKAVELFAQLLHQLHWTAENAPEDVINTVKRHRDKAQYQDDFDRVLAKMEEIAGNYRRRKIK